MARAPGDRYGRGWMVWWKLRAKCWAAFGLGLVIACTAAELSVKKITWLILGHVSSSSPALDTPIARVAISASKTSACPPRVS